MAKYNKNQQYKEAQQQKIAPIPSPILVEQLKPAPQKSDSLLLSINQLCLLLDFSRSTVERLHKNGDIPGQIIIGKSVRYSREIVENWLSGKSLS